MLAKLACFPHSHSEPLLTTDIRGEMTNRGLFLPDPLRGNPVSRIVCFLILLRAPWRVTVSNMRTLPAQLKVRSFFFRVKGGFVLSNSATCRFNYTPRTQNILMFHLEEYALYNYLCCGGYAIFVLLYTYYYMYSPHEHYWY